jgi:pyruvate dehydrogenase E2 component (dihydrolipoamide acetyltransferase)
VGAEKPAEAPAREAERRRGREASADPSLVGDGSPPHTAPGRVKASPLARRIARERGVELSRLTGTGPDGRIVAEDVERAAAPAAAAPAPEQPADVEVVPLTSVRRTIARRLTEAWEIPAFQISMSAEMTRAAELRARLVESAPDGSRPTITDILIRASAAALTRHRPVNAHFAGDSVRLFAPVNCGVAVAVPQGLVVPVIRNAERKTIGELAAEREQLIGRARDGKLRREDIEGGTFTISNLGMYGVEQFTAVLNPPEAAILAVGAIEEKPVVRDGELLIKPLMQMTLTCDHRAVDGATAAEFLRTVKQLLEEPGLML